MRAAATWVAVAWMALGVGGGSAEPADPVAAWRPLFPYVGNWKGADGASHHWKRRCVTSESNHHLEITESAGGAPEVRGVIVLDAAGHGLELRWFAADGAAWDLALAPPDPATARLVFEGAVEGGARVRIVDQQTAPRAYVERVERTGDGGAWQLVSEARFTRTD